MKKHITWVLSGVGLNKGRKTIPTYRWHENPPLEYKKHVAGSVKCSSYISGNMMRCKGSYEACVYTNMAND